MKIPLGKVTPIYKGAYSAAAEYLVNDIVLHTDGNLYWHVSATPTTGVAPTDGTVWAVAFSGADAKAAIEGFVTAAEGWANGTHDGDPVGSSDPAYHNNAAWWNEKAAEQAGAAAGAKAGAESARDAAAEWATGGTSGTPSATNNAKKFAEDAAAAQTAAESARDTAAQWATGGTGGTPSASNNAKYYSEQAAASAAAAAANSGLAPAFDSTATYAIGDFVLYDGAVYRFTATHTGAWDDADAEQTTLGAEIETKADKTDVATADAALARMILASFPVDTVTDAAIASFDDGAEGIPVKALTVNITPVQAAGTPTPESPLPISGWTGANIFDNIFNVNGNLRPVVSMGSSIYDYSTETTVSGASITMDAYSQTGASRRILIGYVKAGVSYLFKLTSSTTWYVSVYDGLFEPNGETPNLITWTTSKESSVHTATLTPDQDGFAYFCFGGGTSLNEATVTDILMEIADSEISIPFPTPPGTVYGGTLTWLGGNQWKVQPTMALVDLGSFSWGKSSSVSGGFYSSGLTDYKFADNATFLCVAYKPDGYGNVDEGYYGANNTIRYLWVSGSVGSREIYIHDDAQAQATAEEFRSTVNGVKLCYELANLPDPIIFTVPSSEIKTLLGQNNIFADCGNIAALTYRADPTLYIAKKLATVLPADPTTDGAYVLTDTVSDGAATKSWESNA